MRRRNHSPSVAIWKALERPPERFINGFGRPLPRNALVAVPQRRRPFPWAELNGASGIPRARCRAAPTACSRGGRAAIARRTRGCTHRQPSVRGHLAGVTHRPPRFSQLTPTEAWRRSVTGLARGQAGSHDPETVNPALRYLRRSVLYLRATLELRMSYLRPIEAASPKSRWRLRAILHDGGEGNWSAAQGQWDRDGLWHEVLAIRWTGSHDGDIGNPQCRRLPTWSIVPDELELPVRETIAGLCNPRSQS